MKRMNKFLFGGEQKFQNRKVTTFLKKFMRNSSICLFFLSLFTMGCAPPKFSETGWRERVESVQSGQLYEPHEKDGLFFNPWLKSDHGLGRVVTWKLSSSQSYDDQEVVKPKVYEDTESQLLNNGDNDFILWIGHGSFLIRTGDQTWLLDPMFSKRALLPARKIPPALSAKTTTRLFPRLNVVISHNHYDHLDEESIRQLSDGYTFYVPKGLLKIVRKWQPGARIVEMDWWQTRKLQPGYELHCLPAQHWSRRALSDVNSSLWASYMIISPSLTIYFGGDSGYFIGYREYGKKYPKIDYALIPTTAYHPRWFMHENHMNIAEAVRAFQELGADYFIPTQWGTFKLGDNPPGYPIMDLKRFIHLEKLHPDQYQELGIGELLRINKFRNTK